MRSRDIEFVLFIYSPVEWSYRQMVKTLSGTDTVMKGLDTLRCIEDRLVYLDNEARAQGIFERISDSRTEILKEVSRLKDSICGRERQYDAGLALSVNVLNEGVVVNRDNQLVCQP